MSEIYTLVSSPLGELLLGRPANGTGLSRLWFMDPEAPKAGVVRTGWQRQDAAFDGVREQLEEYFAGQRRSFDVPLALSGSGWELRVWEALRAIPYGETRSDGQIAAAIGANPAASRAVGLANGRNPVAVIVPCHRVIGADGSLTGFGGGLPRKRALLDLEAAG
jgi:methylated-DNA-[protein]-cysteine S-methyltransferase